MSIAAPRKSPSTKPRERVSTDSTRPSTKVTCRMKRRGPKLKIHTSTSTLTVVAAAVRSSRRWATVRSSTRRLVSAGAPQAPLETQTACQLRKDV